jgi:hypothetical protein
MGEEVQGVGEAPERLMQSVCTLRRVKKQPAPKSLDFYKPILDMAIKAFGEACIVFGSKGYFADKGRTVYNKAFCRNAVKLYAIAQPKGKE